MRVFRILLILFAISAYSEEVVILGSGIGGLTTASYFIRAGITPIVIEGEEFGGVITKSDKIENWPGEKAISGIDLIRKIKNQTKGTIFRHEIVVEVDFSKRPFLITTKDITSGKLNKIYATNCIIDMGCSPKKLQLKNEDKYFGRGISICAMCDGALYKDKIVAVVGSGDKAIFEASHLSNVAKKVYLIMRKDKFSSVNKAKQSELLSKTNVEILFNSQVESIEGKETVSSIVVTNGKKKKVLKVNGLFYAIGSSPNTKIFEGKVALDEEGYIIVDGNKETSVNGVYAIGDITNGPCKQAISAASDGAIAFHKVISNPKIYPHSGIEEITDKEALKTALKKSKEIVLVDFYSPLCGPCKQIAPILENFAKKRDIKIIKVNVHKSLELSDLYKINSVPTVLIFNKNKLVEKKVGTQEILAFILK